MSLLDYVPKFLMGGFMFGNNLCHFGQTHFHNFSPKKLRKDLATSREGVDYGGQPMLQNHLFL